MNARSPQTSKSRVAGSREVTSALEKMYRVKVKVQASWDFPGGSSGGEYALQCRGLEVQSQAGELRSPIEWMN